MPLSTVSFAGMSVSRLIVGGNPFSGHAHKGAELRDEMLDYYTTARIIETLRTAEAHGITTFIGRADAHIQRVLREYWNEGGKLDWIAQTAPEMASLERNIHAAVESGAKAVYLHGGWVDQHWSQGNHAAVEAGLARIRSLGVPGGIAAHYPKIHREAAAALPTDFHLVCCFQCGSIHQGQGERFDLADMAEALACIARLDKPCIAYKVLGAGRYRPAEQLPRVMAALKPSDAVLMGFWTKHHPTQIEETVALFEQIEQAEVVTTS